MPAVTEYLQQVVNGFNVPIINSWVQLVDNDTPSLTYVSQDKTDSTGKFTIASIPPGNYTVNISNVSNTGPWNSTGNTHFFVGADVHGNNVFTTEQDIVQVGGSQLFLRNNGSAQYQGVTLTLKHDASALPNVGNEQWMFFSDRPNTTGSPSNTRILLRRQNPSGTIAQDYFNIDASGTVILNDTTRLYNTGGPNPGVGQIYLGTTNVTGTLTNLTGNITASAGDITSSVGTVIARAIRAQGYSGVGALFGGRFVGATVTGPATGVPPGFPDGGFEGGDFVIAQGGAGGSNTGIWIQVLNGVNNPGTWFPVGRIKIAETTPTGATSNITFNNLPQNFKHLYVELTVQDTSSNTTGVFGHMRYGFNNAAVNTSGYNWSDFNVASNPAGSSGGFGITNDTAFGSFTTTGGGTGAQWWSRSQIWIPYYTSTSQAKTYMALESQINSANAISRFSSGYHDGTTGSPITSLEFTSSGGFNLAAGTSVTVWGEG